MNARALIALVAVIAAIVAGLWIWRSSDNLPVASTGNGDSIAQDDSGRRVLYWYDPMVPQQHFDKPGKSPFMDMQLVPKYADDTSAAGIRVAASVQHNLGMRIATVERTSFGEHINIVARFEANERALHAVPSRVSGYVERLHVRALGDPITRDQKLAEIYSPELLSAQQEFLALHRAARLTDGAELTKAARERLRLFGMASREIDALERGGQPTARFGVYAPASGFVTELATREGGQIQAGATLMTIADLSTLWLIAEVPARDANSIQRGDTVEAQLDNATAGAISGTVDFIYPTLNTQTRTVRVRIVVPNRNQALRPGMFANVSIAAQQRDALSVPSEAIIHTGTRSVVIVKHDDHFRAAEVRTGVEHGGRTEILSGLDAGEQVVASGQFLIDSEASLSGVLTRLSQAPSSNDRAMPQEITAVGKVVAVDHDAGRATLEHGPIPELQWPAMTMPFRIADTHAVHSLAVGDVVRFTVRATPENGEYVIESITKEAAQ